MPLNRPDRVSLQQAIDAHRSAPPEDAAVARFHDRIASHLEKLIAREDRLAAAFAQTETRLLADFIAQPADQQDANAQLCQRLDNGLAEATLSRLIPALLEIAEHKLAIDNPRYLPDQSD